MWIVSVLFFKALLKVRKEERLKMMVIFILYKSVFLCVKVSYVARTSTIKMECNHPLSNFHP